jgi:hypothetical protein
MQRESGLKSLKKEGASIEKYNPFFLKLSCKNRYRIKEYSDAVLLRFINSDVLAQPKCQN